MSDKLFDNKDTCEEILKDIMLIVNSSGEREINADGLIESLPDDICKVCNTRKLTLQLVMSETAKRQNEELRSLMKSRYYYLVSLLLHNATLPLKKVNSTDTEKERKEQVELFVCFVELLAMYDVTCHDRCCVALYELISGTNKKVFESMGDTWNAKFSFLLHSSTDVLQVSQVD